MTTPPRVPAALVGLFPGANVRLRASFSYPGFAWQAGDVVRVLEVDTHLSMFEAVVGGTRLMVSVSDVDLLLDGPQSMCHAARWLATRAGMDPGVTAPWWEYAGMSVDLQHLWRLSASCQAPPRLFALHTTDPAEALAAACVAVGGAS